MPNWCNNEVTVYANSREDLTRLLAMATHPVESDDDSDDAIPDLSPFRMESIHTTPIELMDNSKPSGGEQLQNAMAGNTDYKYDNWYDWRVANWGTKWDMSDVQLDEVRYSGEEEESKRYSFNLYYQTAWSPNIEFWKYVCNMGPFTVEMRYIEEGMGYIGETTVERDSVDDYCVDITPEMFQNIGAVLDEDGEVDWENTDVNESDLFPLKREKVK
jgi:hypothetical protein